jgi:hypothetical protein
MQFYFLGYYAGISEKYFAILISVDEEAKQDTSMKQVALHFYKNLSYFTVTLYYVR